MDENEDREPVEMPEEGPAEGRLPEAVLKDEMERARIEYEDSIGMVRATYFKQLDLLHVKLVRAQNKAVDDYHQAKTKGLALTLAKLRGASVTNTVASGTLLQHRFGVGAKAEEGPIVHVVTRGKEGDESSTATAWSTRAESSAFFEPDLDADTEPDTDRAVRHIFRRHGRHKA